MALRTTIPMMIPIVLLSSLIGITTAQERQKEPPESKSGNQETLRIDTNLVTLNVGVNDKQGHSITGLQQARQY